MESRSSLSAEQLVVVDEVRALLDSGLYEVMDDPENYQANVERLQDLQERALSVMTTAEVESAFVNLGSLRGVAVQLEDVDDVQQQEPDCDCAVGTPGVDVQRCPSGKTCKDGGCTRTAAGCGLMHYIQCHGLCKVKIWPWEIEAP